jgi:uncharacterized cysteine cluster protein YcgN (CxxCxxCC family)
MTEEAYKKKLEEAEAQREALCLRCGSCCGAYDIDACVNLEKLIEGTYTCKVYPRRLGLQKTVSGKTFTCVPIRDLRRFHTVYPLCPYLK